MNLRNLALTVIACGAVALARPAGANVDPPAMKICGVDLNGDRQADSWCMGRNGCRIGPTGCQSW
jgi:hypothetical protein